MAKKLSANELQQQHDRLLTGKEDEVNSLVERLEFQKEKLPKSKHLIIDWGISLLNSYSDMSKKFPPAPNPDSCMPDEYDAFILKSGWSNLDKAGLRKDCSDRIKEEFKYSSGQLEVLKSGIQNLIKCLDCFLLNNEDLDGSLPWKKEWIQKCYEKAEANPEDCDAYCAIAEALGDTSK